MIVFIGLILRQIVAAFFISYFLYQKRKNPKANEKTLILTPKVYVIIPVLREHRKLEESLKYFSQFNYENYEIIIVTTEKERNGESPDSSTIELADKLKMSYSFSHLHYPDAIGFKADQVNYAIKVLSDSITSDIDTFVAIYDVDSRPSLKSLESFRMSYNKNNGINVFQQSSIFVSEKSLETNFFSSLFLRAAAVRANRFVFGYEIPRLIMKRFMLKNFILKFLSNLVFAHCVGHGMFVRLHFFNKNPLPKNEIMEDMFYGFFLNSLHEPVARIEEFDYSEVPDSISSLFNQMARWFLGPSRFYHYLKYCLREYNIKKINLLMLSLSCLFITTLWLSTSFIFLFIVLFFMYSQFDSIFSILLSIFSIAYFFTVFLTVQLEETALNSNVNNFYKKFINRISLVLIYPCIILFHSLPAFYAVFDVLKAEPRLINTKTERL